MRDELRTWIANFNSQETAGSLILPDTTPHQLKQVIRLRYEAAHMFEQIIDQLLQAIHQEGKGRQPLIDALARNLQEERAEGDTDYGPAHVLGRRSFFQALGIDYSTWEQSLGSDMANLEGFSTPARNLITFHREIIKASPLAGGAVMLYWEGRIPRLDYTLLLERVDQIFGFPAVEGLLPRATPQSEIPPRWHLQSHAEHDVYHEEDLIKGVVASVANEAEAELVKVALLSARSAWDRMWHDLKSDVFQ